MDELTTAKAILRSDPAFAELSIRSEKNKSSRDTIVIAHPPGQSLDAARQLKRRIRDALGGGVVRFERKPWSRAELAERVAHAVRFAESFIASYCPFQVLEFNSTSDETIRIMIDRTGSVQTIDEDKLAEAVGTSYASKHPERAVKVMFVGNYK